MHRFLSFLAIVLTAFVARPALGACPGTTGCTISQGCPAGAIIVNPGTSIQAKINTAPDGAKICVKPGTYRGRLDFKGKRITLVSSNGPIVTILNGGGRGPVVTFKKSEAADSVLNGFTIQNGRAKSGGGILIQNASPTIQNSIIRNNTATGDSYSRGGGLWVSGTSAKPLITCVQFLNNRADFGGGGLATTGFADPTLRSILFQGNTAPYGGAIAAHHNGRLDVGTTAFFSNQASVDGGGIHAGTAYGNVLVRQSWFKENTAVNMGGAMWVPAGFAHVINATFDGNQASNGSGVAAGYGGMVDVASSIFVNHSSSPALLNTDPNSSLVNHYNAFFANSGDFQATYGDLGLVFGDPLLGGSCCPGAGSPAIDAGVPSHIFNDADTTRNNMGACGGVL